MRMLVPVLGKKSYDVHTKFWNARTECVACRVPVRHMFRLALQLCLREVPLLCCCQVAWTWERVCVCLMHSSCMHAYAHPLISWSSQSVTHGEKEAYFRIVGVFEGWKNAQRSFVAKANKVLHGFNYFKFKTMHGQPESSVRVFLKACCIALHFLYVD